MGRDTPKRRDRTKADVGRRKRQDVDTTWSPPGRIREESEEYD